MDWADGHLHGGDGIAQVGSVSEIACSALGCGVSSTTAAAGWYEFYNASSSDSWTQIPSGTLSVGTGDSFETLTSSAAAFGGSVSYYTLSAYDLTHSTSYSVSKTWTNGGSMTTPYFGDIIVEDPQTSSGYAPFARFSSVTFTESAICPYISGTYCSSESITTPYSSGYGYNYTMKVGTTENAWAGSVSGTGIPNNAFTVTWKSSSG